MRRYVVFVAVIAGIMLRSGTELPGAEPITGIGPTGDVEQVQSEFAFTEGPAWHPQKGILYFTDIPANHINQLSGGAISVAYEPSNHANGLMVDGEGNLIACEMDGTLVLRTAETSDRFVLADGYQGKRFNAPNDLVIDKQGGIYFTDPRFRAPEPWPQGTEAFYYRAPDGTVTRLSDDLKAPNGIILSPDESKLYVVPSMQKEMMVYAVEAPGKLGEGRVFCTLKQPAGQTNSGGDGLTIDQQGNLYITSGLGIQVYDPAGELLGILEFPEQPANVTFGDADGKTLYVTARTSLYRVKLESVGHRFPGVVKTE
jgi:gluconolactonase